MLFNSASFIFLFLPLVFAGFLLIGRRSHTAAAGWLMLASFVFYGWWDYRYVALLAGSIGFNYGAGRLILYLRDGGRAAAARAVLVAAIVADLALLGWYKYAGFFLSSAALALGRDLAVPEIVLPLGISFFTFTQITFLVDTWRGEAREYSFRHYALFVTWFPHLIAGPLLHHKEMMPQFDDPACYRLDWSTLAAGLTVFIIGLSKKLLLADPVAQFVVASNALSPFTKAAQGILVGFFDAWIGALAYTLQLYFDFSGYSDMAIGLSLLFGVRLPVNFDSPYKARSIIDFWRRWHMTLSRFLRDYLYIPLGGSRRGGARYVANVMITMLLGGLWHGAGWTFVVWGGLHGLYLALNHGWRRLRGGVRWLPALPGPVGRGLSLLLTFLAVVVGWVFFRADSLSAAWLLVKGMAGRHGATLAVADRETLGALAQPFVDAGGRFEPALQMSLFPVLYWIAALLAIAWFAPNTQQIMRRFRVVLEDRPAPVRGLAARTSAWLPRRRWAVLAGVLFMVCVLNLERPSEFLYFQF